MVRYFLACAAVLGLLLAGGIGPVAAQTSTAPATEQPKAKPAAKKMEMHQGMVKSSKMPMKEGHRLDNVADKLNGCQARPQNERQRCMDEATK